MSELPIVNPEWASDERTEGVLLLDSGEGWKITAEDREDHWFVVDWATTNIDGALFWVDESGYSIVKTHVALLAQHTPEAEQ